MHETLDLLFLGHLLALLAVSLALVYPLYSHVQNVAHTRALALQSGALFALTLGIAAATLIGPGGLVSELLFTASTALLCASMWLFAREFVRRDDRYDDTFGDAFGDAFDGEFDGGFCDGDEADDADDVGGFEDA